MALADPATELVGWDVLAVGRRQAWLFVTFGAPTADRSERTLWIDNPWRIEPRAANHPTLADLEPLVTMYVKEVEFRTEELSIAFEDGRRLVVATAPTDRDSDGWWFGAEGG